MRPLADGMGELKFTFDGKSGAIPVLIYEAEPRSMGAGWARPTAVRVVYNGSDRSK